MSGLSQLIMPNVNVHISSAKSRKLQTKKEKNQILRERWGWAKRSFIHQQLTAGSTLANAEHLWLVRRRDLHAQNIKWPVGQHITPFEKGGRGDYEEYASEEEVIRELESTSKRNKRHLPDPVSSDPKQARTESSNRDPYWNLRPGDPNDEPYFDWDDQEDIDWEQLFDAEQRNSQETAPSYQGKGKGKAPSRHIPEQFNFDPNQAGPSHRPDSHYAATSLGPGNEPLRISEDVTTTVPPDMGKDDMETESGGSKRKGTEGGDPPPPKLSREGGPVSGGGSIIGGGDAPGQNDTAGRGGTGGGLAGAGNNMFFQGFGGATKPRMPSAYTYTDTYKRSFQTHSLMQPRLSTTPAAVLNCKTLYLTDQTQAELAGFPAGFIHGYCDHDGLFIPYDIMEASMKNCDWNKPMDHLAYEVVEFGFNIPNLRLSVMNNDRTTTTQVAPAPPADARMWMFVDVNNDYGMPMVIKQDNYQHNFDFAEEDFLIANAERYALPHVEYRHFRFDPNLVVPLLTGDPTWAGTDEDFIYHGESANALYDIKRHPGYHEFVLSEASMGLSYTPNSPVVRFPHPPQSSFDGNYRDSSKGDWWDSGEVNSTIHQWQTTTAPQLENATQPDLATDAGVIALASVNYYVANVSAYSKNISDTNPITIPEHRYHDAVGSEPVRPYGDSTVIAGASSAVVRTGGRSNISDDGAVHCKHISKRPPIFMFGLYREFEDQSDGVKFWRYYLYGQVEYYCKIKWHVQPARFKPYLPIGLGGVYTQVNLTTQPALAAQLGRRYQLEARRLYRMTSAPISCATSYEKSTTNNTMVH